MNGYIFEDSAGRVYLIGAHQFRIESEHVAMSGNWVANGTYRVIGQLEQTT